MNAARLMGLSAADAKARAQEAGRKRTAELREQEAAGTLLF